MNQIRLLLIGIIFIGTLLTGIGVYFLTKPEQPPTNQTIAPTNSYTNSYTNSTPYVETKQTRINKTVTVPSTTMWYDTGIDIKSGSFVKINYRGGHWTNVVGSNFVTGEGKGGYELQHKLIVPNSNLSALVGKVGSNSFHVGNSYSGNPGAGKLYLSLNDLPRTYNDNGGELEVLVEVK